MKRIIEVIGGEDEVVEEMSLGKITRQESGIVAYNDLDKIFIVNWAHWNYEEYCLPIIFMCMVIPWKYERFFEYITKEHVDDVRAPLEEVCGGPLSEATFYGYSLEDPLEVLADLDTPIPGWMYNLSDEVTVFAPDDWN